MLDELRGLLNSRSGPQALLLVELNDPVRWREALGFERAAALFEQLSQQLHNLFAARASVKRFGDSALCIFLPKVHNAGHAVLAAERIRRCVLDSSEEVAALARLLRIGIALHPRDGETADVLLRAAQLATAMARRRSEVVAVFDSGCSESLQASNRIGAALGAALDDGQLTLHYQPKVRINDGTVIGVEALMRWFDGVATVATPDVFIPAAEELGLGHEFAWMSLTNGLRLSQSLGGLPVAVNITPAVLHQKEFVEMVESALRAWDTRADTLTLELTEGALVADFAEARARLTHLRKQGIRVSIDDFGTGYSSLSYFKSIPADELKIDKSFIVRMVEDSADQRLVAAIIALAHQFDLKVVAEGVESRACLDMLAALDCDSAQGFLFGPAMAEDRLRHWLWESRSARVGA